MLIIIIGLLRLTFWKVPFKKSNKIITKKVSQLNLLYTNKMKISKMSFIIEYEIQTVLSSNCHIGYCRKCCLSYFVSRR